MPQHSVKPTLFGRRIIELAVWCETLGVDGPVCRRIKERAKEVRTEDEQ